MSNGWTKWIAGIGITIIVGLVGGIAKYQQVKIDDVKDRHTDDMTEHNKAPHTTTARELEHLHEEMLNNTGAIKAVGRKVDANSQMGYRVETKQAVQTEILKRIEETVKDLKEK